MIRTKLFLAASAGLFAAAITTAAAAQPIPLFAEQGPSHEGQQYELSLDEAIALVRERSFRTQRSQRNLEQSGLRHANARAQYLPRLNTGITADQSARAFRYESDRFGEFTQPTRGEFRSGASADISMPLDISGTIKRQVEQAEISREMSGRDLANALLDVTLDVQNAYLNALRAQNQLDADEGVVRQIEDLLGRAGSGSAIASFLEVELANARQAAQYSRESADNAQDGLKQLLRAPPEIRLRLTTDLRDRKEVLERDALLERALAGRPDVQSALLRIRQSEVAVRQASDYRKPSVRLNGFISEQMSGRSFYGERDRYSSRGGGISLNVPLVQWDNGQLARNKEISRVQLRQAQADSQELRERVAYDLRQQLLAVTRAEARIRNLPDRAQALEALDRAERILLSAPPETANALVAQVTNARRAWRASETATAEAFIDYNIAVFRLKRLIGDGTTADPRLATATLP